MFRLLMSTMEEFIQGLFKLRAAINRQQRIADDGFRRAAQIQDQLLGIRKLSEETGRPVIQHRVQRLEKIRDRSLEEAFEILPHLARGRDFLTETVDKMPYLVGENFLAGLRRPRIADLAKFLENHGLETRGIIPEFLQKLPDVQQDSTQESDREQEHVQHKKKDVQEASDGMDQPQFVQQLPPLETPSQPLSGPDPSHDLKSQEEHPQNVKPAQPIEHVEPQLEPQPELELIQELERHSNLQNEIYPSFGNLKRHTFSEAGNGEDRKTVASPTEMNDVHEMRGEETADENLAPEKDDSIEKASL
ncbi:unnamed protein product [Caenorhabditis auriculariae]|uniref:Uncharacterized protein n=1 Tax=Caenorhabditis auriculariae TaxID=2777116 RepID=A0A8S1HCN0_9PELO|nr:unnamed protein product [Caenorhabditis auriculariae]